MPASRLSTHAQLAEIRAGLLGPRQLFARVEEAFAADSRDTVSRRKAHRDRSRGKLEDGMWKVVGGAGLRIAARTKSEARAFLKQQLGTLKPGVKLVRVA